MGSCDGRDFWQASGRHLSDPTSGKDGTRVVNYAQWKSSENWENLCQIGSKFWFSEMGKYAKPDPQLYEACLPAGQNGKRAR